MTPELQLKTLKTREEIESAVNRLADSIRHDYSDKSPILVSILKGSFMFAADLVRRLNFPLEVEFVRLASYGSGTESSGQVDLVQGIRCPINGRHVLIVEDIIDTGKTLSFLIDYLSKLNPASLKLCALADKPSRRQTPVTIDYLGFTVPNKFIVGYGADLNEKYRYLPEIYTLE